LQPIAFEWSLCQPNWFELHSFALVFEFAPRRSPISHLSPALVIGLHRISDAGIALVLNWRACGHF
jgi:hypothetical protein